MSKGYHVCQTASKARMLSPLYQKHDTSSNLSRSARAARFIVRAEVCVELGNLHHNLSNGQMKYWTFRRRNDAYTFHQV